MYQKYFKEVMSTEPLSRKLGKTDFRPLQEIYSKMKKADPSPELPTNSTRGQHWFCRQRISQGYSAETGADMLLTNAAVNINKPRSSLESLDEVSAIFKAQPEETMLNFLKASIKTNKEETEDIKNSIKPIQKAALKNSSHFWKKPNSAPSNVLMLNTPKPCPIG